MGEGSIARATFVGIVTVSVVNSYVSLEVVLACEGFVTPLKMARESSHWWSFCFLSEKLERYKR
jgi:hypothetical protein